MIFFFFKWNIEFHVHLFYCLIYRTFYPVVYRCIIKHWPPYWNLESFWINEIIPQNSAIKLLSYFLKFYEKNIILFFYYSLSKVRVLTHGTLPCNYYFNFKLRGLDFYCFEAFISCCVSHYIFLLHYTHHIVHTHAR